MATRRATGPVLVVGYAVAAALFALVHTCAAPPWDEDTAADEGVRVSAVGASPSRAAPPPPWPRRAG